MSKQIYFSFIIAALSFIAVKRIQKAGVEHFYMLETLFQKEDGWFNFEKPEFILNLPFELREISGVTKLEGNEIACIQDENGIIFVYDLDSDSIIRQFQFGQNGDYEGITMVDSTFYVLRSDATLIEINSPWDSSNVIETKLNIPNLDNEGLCYDQRTNSLLLAPKSKTGKGPEYKDSRAIYAIDLATKKLNEKPLFVISVSEIEAFANEKGIPLPQKLSKLTADSISALKFMPSELAVHPKTDEIYILSAIDHTMAVYTKTGELINFICLDSDLFNKPEGITFLENGDLIITNEGQMGIPTLLKFQWQKLIEEE